MLQANVFASLTFYFYGWLQFFDILFIDMTEGVFPSIWFGENKYAIWKKVIAALGFSMLLELLSLSRKFQGKNLHIFWKIGKFQGEIVKIQGKVDKFREEVSNVRQSTITTVICLFNANQIWITIPNFLDKKSSNFTEKVIWLKNELLALFIGRLVHYGFLLKSFFFVRPNHFC